MALGSGEGAKLLEFCALGMFQMICVCEVRRCDKLRGFRIVSILRIRKLEFSLNFEINHGLLIDEPCAIDVRKFIIVPTGFER